MKFRFETEWEDRPLSILWENGEMESERRDALHLMEAESELPGLEIGPVCGPYYRDDDILDKPLGALSLMRSLFGHEEKLTILKGKFTERKVSKNEIY